MSNNWSIANYWGIVKDGAPPYGINDSAFNAGHLNDVLRLSVAPYNPILVASDTSGVWLVWENGGFAWPLGFAWEDTHFNCLCVGIHREHHVYAAGDALYETDTTHMFPLLNWRKIKLIGAHGFELGIKEIYRVVVMEPDPRLVLATDAGVFWSDIPAPGGNYVFKKAEGLPGKRYSGLAMSSQYRIVAGAWGTDGVHCGIFIGIWSGAKNNLVFVRSSIKGNINTKMMLRTEIASCATYRDALYAVCGGGGGLQQVLNEDGTNKKDCYGNFQLAGDDLIYRVLSSSDGGVTWNVVGNKIVGSQELLFDGTKDVIGHVQLDGYNLCVGVSPFDPRRVAIGLGGFAISEDGGASWQLFTAGSSKHLHADVHAVVFDQSDPAQRKLFICSDGGLASTPDIGKTFDSACNRLLPNLQFTRISPSPVDQGLIAGSLQDNGNTAATLYVYAWPWNQHDVGDGRLTTFLAHGQLVRMNNTATAENKNKVIVDYGREPRAAKWDASTRKLNNLKLLPDYPLSYGVIPVGDSGDGLLSDPDEFKLTSVTVETVRRPAWTSPDGEAMLAVATRTENVYGLFEKASGALYWLQLAAIPHKPDLDASGKEVEFFATAVASHDGNTIFVGTNNGKVFRFDAPDWQVSDISNPTNNVAITRFAILPNSSLFCVAANHIFFFDTKNWTEPNTGLPADQAFTALEVDVDSDPPITFVSTEIGVWGTTDLGAIWYSDAIGLPARPHCRDLRVVTESSGARFLYVGTYGWSIFRQLINVEDHLRTITIDVDMYTVDRQVLDDVIWAPPTHSNTLQIGPLHPLEEVTLTEEDGDEIRVVLKLRLAWFIDDSVEVSYEATLIDMDEGDNVDDQTSDKFQVAQSSDETRKIDLASDEYWPDRAHIEIKVTNS